MKTILSLCIVGALCFSLLSCHDEEKIIPVTLSGQKVSDAIAVLNWTCPKPVDGFNVWRIVKQDGATSAPKLLASVDSSTFSFVDDNIPLSTNLIYYVTASMENEEVKSNEINLDGATYFNILPYQMKLLPENKLALVREYNGIAVINYDEKVIVKRKEFPGIGMFDIGFFNGKKELYVPSSDHNVYICDPIDLTILDTLETNAPVTSVAVTSNGNIFVSGRSSSFPLKVYNRSTLSLVSEYPGEGDSRILLQSDSRLLAMSSHIFPPTMSFYTLDKDGGMISKADDPYFWEYEMEGERLKVSAHYVVTSNKGVVFTADDDMAYVTTLTYSGNNQSDFEFSQDGKSIFSAMSDQRTLHKYLISGSQVSPTFIPTRGYPWMLARDGNKMVILSSPVPFNLNSLTGEIIIETVTLN
jgi:WD40 repeat protein